MPPELGDALFEPAHLLPEVGEQGGVIGYLRRLHDRGTIADASRHCELQHGAGRLAGSCLVGALDLPSRERPPNVAFRDKIRDWEALGSLAVTGFFRGGSVVPTLGVVVDPVNQFSMEAFGSVDVFVRNDVVVNLAQRWFVTPRGHATPIFETWGLAGMNAGRSETSLRMTLQF